MTPLVTTLLAIVTCAVLSLIALMHAYWALGGHWPAPNRDALAATVVGSPGPAMPSRMLTLLVVAMIFCFGIVPLVWVDVLPVPIDSQLQGLAMMALAGIFLIRGAVTYTPFAERYSTVEPFVTLNRRYYSPLCLAIGLSFVVLLIVR